MNQTVGLVLVSHSAQLAAGLADLLGQLGVSPGCVAAAGGAEDGGIGTSYELIRSGIEAVDQDRGVCILVDLGSALLTTRLVLEDLGGPGQARADVVIADAPFVEGAVAAAVAAAAGSTLADVVAEAESAYNYRKLAQ
ncbi:MAG TPA: dihydroxyacetone kinase phosphoryl donor subunit DhaM [Actinocrinis sp.]|nr:dihydroxyacetone kinase phosphoryl donor subunit DhaM [Actinocrinis sp.]